MNTKLMVILLLIPSHNLTNGINWNSTTNTSTVKSTSFPDPCSSAPIEGRNKFFTILLAFIFVVAVVGNSFAIVVIVFSKTIRAHPTNIFIASLAVTDLGVVLFTLPIRMNSYLHNQSFCFNLHVCKMFNVTDLIFHIGSVSHLFVIALERFIAVSKPFLYHTYMTNNITTLCLFATWSYCAVWTGLGTFNWEDPSIINLKIINGAGMRLCLNENRIYFTTLYSLTYVIPLCIMGVLYAAIWKIALKQARVIASLSPAYLKESKRKPVTKKHEMKATKTLAIVYGAFGACWLPITVITLSSSWCPECYRDFRLANKTAFEFVVSLFIEALPSINSCLNPFVYILFNKNFRKASKTLVLKVLRMLRDNTDLETSSQGNNPARKRLSQMSNRHATEIYELSDPDGMSSNGAL